MLDDKYEKLHRQQRRIQISLIIVGILIALGIIILLTNGDKRSNNTIPVPGVAGLQGERGEKGEPGENGYTPLKNIDYFDGNHGMPGYTPQKGIDYNDGRDGKDGVNGKDGYTPVKGVDYEDGAQGAPGRTPIITCNTETQQFEQHYAGDEVNTPIEGSDCVAG